MYIYIYIYIYTKLLELAESHFGDRRADGFAFCICIYSKRLTSVYLHIDIYIHIYVKILNKE